MFLILPNHTKRSNRERGFSLVEMIVYITILVFMLGIIMSIVISFARSQRAVKASKEVENSAIISLERISREIRLADGINVSSSTFDLNPGVLVLNSTDEGGSPRTVEFSFSSGGILLRENGLNVGAVSQTDARVTNLVFHIFSNNGVTGIRTEVSIESGTSTYYRSGNFYSSTTLR